MPLHVRLASCSGVSVLALLSGDSRSGGPVGLSVLLGMGIWIGSLPECLGLCLPSDRLLWFQTRGLCGAEAPGDLGKREGQAWCAGGSQRMTRTPPAVLLEDVKARGPGRPLSAEGRELGLQPPRGTVRHDGCWGPRGRRRLRGELGCWVLSCLLPHLSSFNQSTLSGLPRKTEIWR